MRKLLQRGRVRRNLIGFRSSEAAELAALEARYREAITAARDTYSEIEFNRFLIASANSQAVTNRTLGALSDWLNSSSPLFHAFHQQVRTLGRSPFSSNFDKQREAAESTINPYYFADISYAALSIDEKGMDYYGEYTVLLKESTINDRTSVFERNPFYFNRGHRVVAGNAPPKGYRATWRDRGKLCATKLQSKIKSGITQDSFAAILMERRGQNADCDYVEAHIYGPIHRACIDMISGPEPREVADKIILGQALRKAAEQGIAVRVP